MNHTPGPWSIVQDAPLNPKSRYSIGSRQPNGFAIYVCTIRTERNLIRDGKETANARLIAAAPELLAALKRLLPMWESGIKEPWVEAARAAIAKAEGGESVTTKELENDLGQSCRKYISTLSKDQTLLPELVGAMKALLAVCELNLDDMEDETRFTIERAEAVIAKVEGREV